MMLLIQIDFSSAQFNILHWGLSAYRKSLSDGMTVGSGGSAKWNRCSKVFVLAELVQFVIKCLIFLPFYESIGDKYGLYLTLWSDQIMFHVVYPELFIDLNKFGNLEKSISYFPNFWEKVRDIFFPIWGKIWSWEGYIALMGKFITFIIFALKDLTLLGHLSPIS